MLSNIAFEIFGLKIYYYGLVYFFGFLTTYFLFINLSIKDNRNKILEKEKLENIFFYFSLSSIIGARIFYVVFYDLSYYLKNPLKIFFLNEGGMAIFGALFFLCVTIYYFSRKEKYNFNFFKISDNLAIFSIFFISLGRIANFLNEEILGIETNFFSFGYHPVVLYESFLYFLLFLFFLYMKVFYEKDKKVFLGFYTTTLIFYYSIVRFFMEFLKDDSKFLYFNLSQIFAIILFLIGIFLYKKIKKNKSKYKK